MWKINEKANDTLFKINHLLTLKLTVVECSGFSVVFFQQRARQHLLNKVTTFVNHVSLAFDNKDVLLKFNII